jgi:hypothetical protein
MVRWLIKLCLVIDTWLQSHLGRPYNAVLGVGLIIEIVRRLSELPHHVESATHVVGVALVVLFEIGLLIHQVGALDHHFRRREKEETPAD